MADSLRFHPLVAGDLAAATKWYEGISADLGNRFRRAVNARLDSIELRPASFGCVRGNLRAARVDGFPYLVVFLHETQATKVVGVFHAAADPDKWGHRSSEL